MSDVFISYSRKDHEAAATIARALEAEGFSVWWDLQPDGQFAAQISEALETAHCVLVLWSEESVQSLWVRDEASLALEDAKLVPAMLNNVPLPLGFRSLHATNLANWRGDLTDPTWKNLVRTIRQTVRGNQRSFSDSPSLALPRTDAFKNFYDIDAGPLMRVIPGGNFLMGSRNSEALAEDVEFPQHLVTIARAFAVSVHPITFQEFDSFVASTGGFCPSDEGWGRGQRPVINVSWFDAHAYASWLSKMTGAVYRLLSEAEWEYACRGGTTSTYCYGDNINNYEANFAAVVGRTTTVGSFPPNEFGLYDMHGNVWEWVEDTWSANYAGALAGGGSSIIIDDPNIRVVRGGSWINAAKDLRAACRNASLAFQRSNTVGFRLARDI